MIGDVVGGDYDGFFLVGEVYGYGFFLDEECNQTHTSQRNVPCRQILGLSICVKW